MFEVLSKSIYFLLTLYSLFVAYLFYKSNNGELRKRLIVLFVCLAIRFTLRGTFEMSEQSDLNIFLFSLPLFIGFTYLAEYLVMNFINNKNN